MNILICSVGTRNKIVQYFKTACDRVIAVDADFLASALYEADAYYTVPRISDEGYIERVMDICAREQISGVLSLIDPELSLLAKNRDRFEKNGVTFIGSSYALCEMSLDKRKMYKWLRVHGYPCARTYEALEDFKAGIGNNEIDFPVFVKPAEGSASVAVSIADDMETVELLCNKSDGLIIQEYLNGQEIGADVYIDMISGQTVSVFTKKKIAMRAGETDKAVSFKDEKLFRFIERFVSEAGYRGQVDIDIFQIDGEYYISEVNPRFGGGYPHAYECGCDHMKLIVNNLSGLANEKQIGGYDEGVYMMKYSEVSVKRQAVETSVC